MTNVKCRGIQKVLSQRLDKGFVQNYVVKNYSATINRVENLINDYFTHACWIEGDYNN